MLLAALSMRSCMLVVCKRVLAHLKIATSSRGSRGGGVQGRFVPVAVVLHIPSLVHLGALARVRWHCSEELKEELSLWEEFHKTT